MNASTFMRDPERCIAVAKKLRAERDEIARLEREASVAAWAERLVLRVAEALPQDGSERIVVLDFGDDEYMPIAEANYARWAAAENYRRFKAPVVAVEVKYGEVRGLEQRLPTREEMSDPARREAYGIDEFEARLASAQWALSRHLAEGMPPVPATLHLARIALLRSQRAFRDVCSVEVTVMTEDQWCCWQRTMREISGAADSAGAFCRLVAGRPQWLNDVQPRLSEAGDRVARKYIPAGLR